MGMEYFGDKLRALRMEKNLIKNYYNLKNADYKLILKFSKNISKIILQSIKFLNL